MNISVKTATGSLVERAQRVAAVAKASADQVDRDGCFPQSAIYAMKAVLLCSVQIPVDLGGEAGGTGEISELCSNRSQARASRTMLYAFHQLRLPCMVEPGIAS